MAKVTFEFDDIEDRDEVNLVVNRHKLASALYDLINFRSAVYNRKIYDDSIIVVKDGKVLTEEDYDKYRESGDYPVSNTQDYMNVDELETKLGNIVDQISGLIEF